MDPALTGEEIVGAAVTEGVGGGMLTAPLLMRWVRHELPSQQREGFGLM